MSGQQVLVSMKNIVKKYPGTVALSGANLDIHQGEIIGLLGENGAGKSTMMKILVGYETSDSGEITAGGEKVRFHSTRDAMKYNIGMVYQDQSLLPNLTVSQNLFLGYEKLFTNGGFLNHRKMKETAQKILDLMQLRCSPWEEVSNLPLSTRELLEIGRLLWLSEVSGHPPVIVLDEPTTVLDAGEVQQLFRIVRGIRDKAGIIFISHHLDEVLELVDRVVVFRDGREIASEPAESLTVPEIQSMMIGRELNPEYYLVDQQNDPVENVVLQVDRLSKQGVYNDISFSVRAGEIVAIVGLDGSGKEEVCRSILGAIKPDQGEVWLAGNRLDPKRPDKTIKQGLGYVPQDRREEGIFLHLDLTSNIVMNILSSIAKLTFINNKKEDQIARKWMERLRVRASSPFMLASQLSGGNQQKVILAKWLASDIKAIILDHPTRGIDVGAKAEIYAILRELSNQGVAIVMMCDSLEEDIGLSHRLLIMKDGKLIGEKLADSKQKPTVLEIMQAL
jgi:ribose transport system ATP-binding protein